MEKLTVRRVGVLVKPHHPEAVKSICRLLEWLTPRGITLVVGPRVERAEIERETGCTVETLEHDDLAASVDLIVVLGGDGTMIATARLLDNRDVPVVGVSSILR
ncbi:MAG: NAD(+)/NADH kinase [Acidobacteria bacterium]|nr:NAD(+)/NADH kinase [Acidobacteriota bacterium]